MMLTLQCRAVMLQAREIAFAQNTRMIERKLDPPPLHFTERCDSPKNVRDALPGKLTLEGIDFMPGNFIEQKLYFNNSIAELLNVNRGTVRISRWHQHIEQFFRGNAYSDCGAQSSDH